MNKKFELANGEKIQTKPGFIVSNDTKVRIASPIERKMARNFDATKMKNHDINYACELENRNQGLIIKENSIEELRFTKTTPELKDQTLS